MKIAILGAGSVGSALAGAWVAHGHHVRLGVPTPDSEKTRTTLRRIGSGATAMLVPKAAAGSDVIVLATPWTVTDDAIRECGDLRGRLIIDCTNPLHPDLSGLALGQTTSGAEQVAAWAKGASVFKALNQTGANNMASQAGYSMKPVMFVAGDDAAKKPTVLRLVSEVGFEAIDAGPLVAARWLEPLAMLWIHLAIRQGLGREFALALMRRDGNQ